VQQAISGKETRIARQTYPRYKYALAMNLLRSSAAYQSSEYQYIIGFFNSLLGSFDTFLYQDADDNSVTSQTIGTGDNTATAFQLIRSFGSFIEPVLAPNVVSAVYLNGTSIPSAGYSAPGAATLGSSANGSLGAATYYVRVAWVTPSGETLAGTEASLAVSASHVLIVAQPASPPAGAGAWNIYVSNTGGGGSGAETFQATVNIATSSWTEPTSGLVAGASLPAANTTGWSVSTWGNSSPGVLTFDGPVESPVAITADFSYYWPCRMSDDSLGFSLFMDQMYECKKFGFESVKN
jgi:hypothetical protein